ncbi:class I SAM-dependent methyltransferase [Allostreptomyces psammosilenae]|uniref:2-polyprenyl-3-methyl-5-hydroxy-6-metoxy-1, 4-benzoquinol methylase n=1 Tax=Allostreptomyces psammosilenae TaxID=1892865 RepID=A0A852ZVF7_9ACTN|nr:class I SAM-dependent methyltransferase [Allostreptomyces psammosilenae]NYI06366.1 2-polyprenyl-3-methyl-5-hydroxy-6-metoxy-1,4-benzoquinol methylase [Allostreptomyces psammosilenae]
MPFDHNDHYHRLLLRRLPAKAATALDVGCGTGRFARRLAGLGVDVDAIDPSAEAIRAARELSDRELSARGVRPPRYRQADVTREELPRGHYDYVSCLASIHHMPFETVARLRDALAPGGVLVILGCYPERTPADFAWSLAAVPANAVARIAVAAAERTRRAPAPAAERAAVERAPAPAAERAVADPTAVRAPVKAPTMPLRQIRQEAVALLPGCTIRRLLFWRYLLVYRAPEPAAAR